MTTVAQPARDLAAALRAAGVEVDVSSRARAEYSSDASLYRVVPQAVAFPRSADDVEAAVSVCRSLGVPITARGGGTSVAGNAVGSGLILEFSRHMNRVVSVDPETATAVVQPGVVLDVLQAAASPYGLRFGPDPSTHNRCTMGGVLGNNACGSRSLGYGRPSDNVAALDVLTGRGERLLARAGLDPAGSPTTQALNEITRSNLAVIRTEFGRFGRQVSGYSLEHLLPERRFDVARALVGSEGTLGILLDATVRLVRAPRATTLVVLGYPDMASAADAAPTIRGHAPKALEGIDARIVDVVRRHRGPGFVPDLPRGAGWLMIEMGGDTASEVAQLAARVIADAGALDSRVITDPGEAAQLWRIREDGAGLASRPADGQFFHSGWEDAAVPPEQLGAYLRDLDALLTHHGLTGLPYGHFGEGCVHVRINFDLAFDKPAGVRLFRTFLLDGARLVARYGGSMSGEHGDGRARSELLPLMYSPQALAVFGDVKRAFDPDGLLNPGVLVDPAPMTADLRAPAARPLRTQLALTYAHDDGNFSNAVHRCTGVGKCRADITGSGGVMCPSYLATKEEKDSTRGRARVLQEMVNGSHVKGGWRAPEVREALDLCLQCKGCAVDCPTGVDMASYKVEVLYQSFRRRLRPMSHYSLGWLPRWARLASHAPRLVNKAVALGERSSVGKRLAGLDPKRPLIKFAERTFRDWFAGHPAATGDPVVLWVDTFTNHFTPQVGKAAVAVLEAAGYSVRIPERAVCCGLTWISTGQLDTARKQLRRSVDALSGPASEGIPIVGLEPSCTAVFRGEAAELLGSDAPGVRTVADMTHTLAELLQARAGWEPPDLSDVRGVAQPHCHQHAVMGWGADEEILRRAGASVTSVGGCCGLAGNFGAERGHFDVSVAVAETSLLPAVRAAGDDAVVLTDGFSCRTQLDHLAHREGQHLAEILSQKLPH